MFLSRTLLGSSKMRKPIFSTFSPKKFMPNSIYVFMDSWPSFTGMKLNNTWASAFSPIGISILGSKCSFNFYWQINETSLPESNHDGIWTPLLEMLTLGHFATVCCMILILAWAKILGWIVTLKHCLFQEYHLDQPWLLPCPGVSSLLSLRCVY